MSADGGTVESSPGGRMDIDPVSSLEVLANAALRNYRVRLFDEADRVVPSDDSPRELADGLRYQVTLLEPLKPGHRYAVVVDAQLGAAMLDADGRPRPDRRIELQVTGTKERRKAPAKTKKKKGKRR